GDRPPCSPVAASRIASGPSRPEGGAPPTSREDEIERRGVVRVLREVPGTPADERALRLEVGAGPVHAEAGLEEPARDVGLAEVPCRRGGAPEDGEHVLLETSAPRVR